MSFDPHSPEFRVNPYPVYEALRETAPITYSDTDRMWVVSRYDDVLALLKDRRFGRSLEGTPVATLRPRSTPDDPMHAFRKLSEDSLFDKEPPDHTRLRGLVHKAFTPKRVEALREKIRTITDNLLDTIEADGEADLLQAYAVPLPVTVIAEMLGVPEADRHRLRPWSHDIVALFELSHTPEQARAAVRAASEFAEYLRGLAAERRAHPGDDLMTALVEAEENGDRLTEDELVATCVLLLNAGHEATVNVVGNGLYALLSRPDQTALLRENPALVPTAVEEMMRFDTPLQLFRRKAREEVVYQGHAFPAGSEIALLFGSANRDPRRFAQADQMDITRQDNPHISFSAGIHFCLGAPLARLELNVSIATLMRRFPRLRLVGPAPRYRDSFVIRGLEQLQVAWS
jgi:cytochrome P450